MLPTFQNRLFTLSCDVKRCLLDVLWSWVEVGGHGSDIASSENLLASKEALFQAPLAYIFPLRSWVEVFLSIQVSRGDEESDSSLRPPTTSLISSKTYGQHCKCVSSMYYIACVPILRPKWWRCSLRRRVLGQESAVLSLLNIFFTLLCIQYSILHQTHGWILFYTLLWGANNAELIRPTLYTTQGTATPRMWWYIDLWWCLRCMYQWLECTEVLTWSADACAQ